MCYPINIAKFLRTAFLKNASGGCFLTTIKAYNLLRMKPLLEETGP